MQGTRDISELSPHLIVLIRTRRRLERTMVISLLSCHPGDLELSNGTPLPDLRRQCGWMVVILLLVSDER
jgi:hypothetical protein